MNEEPFAIGNAVEAKCKGCWYPARILEEIIDAHEIVKIYKVRFFDPDYEEFPLLIKQCNLRESDLFSICNPWVEAYDKNTRRYYPSELLDKSEHDACWTIRFDVDRNDGEGIIYHDFPEMKLQDSLWIHKNETTIEDDSEHDKKFMDFACSMVKGTMTELTKVLFY